MLAKLLTYSLYGIDARPVDVEVDISPAAMPKTILVGLAEAAVKESTHRIERALVNSGYTRPVDRIVINLLPVMNIMFLLIPGLLLAMEVASMAAVVVSGHMTAGGSQHRGQRLVAADVFAQAVHDLHRAVGGAGGRPAPQVQGQAVASGQGRHRDIEPRLCWRHGQDPLPHRARRRNG